MILEKQTQSLIHQEGTSKGTVGMSLDMDSAQVLMQMLSKNLYSDAIGSTVRECASNALDSHRRAGTSDPIIVSLQQSGASSSWEFSVEDFGIGLDANDVENIISKYGKSTKRNSTTELGMMGLGFKAPLAYSSSFYFTCRKDGMERKYMMYEGEETNSIDLLYEKPTDQRNGVKVIIPIKYGDRYEFVTKIKQQLAYFENVYFNVHGIDNTFKIHRSENYQISALCNDRYLHVCLDNVYYPLDVAKLDLVTPGGNRINDLRIPVGLRFSLTDGLFPTPNRESLRYTQEAKELIKNKINVIANEFMTKYNESVVDTEDIHAVIEHYSSSNRHIKDHEGHYWEVSNMLAFATIPQRTPVLLNVTYFTAERIYKLREYLLNEYEVKYTLTNWRNRLSECKSHWDKDIRLSDLNKSAKIAVYEGLFPERKRRYIKELWKGVEVKFVKKSHPFTLFSKDKGWTTSSHLNNPDNRCYHDLLKLHQHHKSKWRAIITEFQRLLSSITSSFIDLDAIDIPEAWIIADKASRSTGSKAKTKLTDGVVKERGDVNCKLGVPLEKDNGNSCKFVPFIFKSNLLGKAGGLTVYGKDTDKALLDRWYGLCTRSTKFVILSDREMNNVKSYNIHNWMHIDDFLKGDNQVYRRAVTCQLIRELFRNYRSIESSFVNGRDVDKLVNIVKDLKEDLVTLSRYYHKYRGIDSGVRISGDEMNDNLVKGNVDQTIIDVYNRAHNMLSVNGFINELVIRCAWNIEKLYVQMFTQLCRYNKIRMNPEHYNITEGWQPVDENGQLILFSA